MVSIYILDKVSEEHDTKLLNEMKGIHTSQLSKIKGKNSRLPDTDTQYSNYEGGP
jgi:hypothetical protein